MKMRILLVLLLVVSIATIISCGVAIKGKIDPPGIYECKSVNLYAPTYRFDSTAETTLRRFGQGAGIEFMDLNSGKEIRLYLESGLKYNCECIQKFEESG